MNTKPVFAVIVTYNSGADVWNALDALTAQDFPLLRVCVVDNASNDATVSLAAEHLIAPLVIKNAENVGFAKAVNQALVFRRPNEDLLLLNPDGLLEGSALERLSTFLHERGAGAVGALVTHPNGRLRVLSCGHFPSLRRVVNQNLFLNHLLKARPELEGVNLLPAQAPGATEVDWVSGSCMLVKGSVVDEIGPLTERWFMYAEDLEYCCRIRDAGHAIFHIADAKMIHRVGGSQTSGDKVRTWWLDNMRELFEDRLHPDLLTQILWRLAYVIGCEIRSAIYLSRAVAAADSEVRALWRFESRRFRVYAVAAAFHGWSRSRI